MNCVIHPWLIVLLIFSVIALIGSKDTKEDEEYRSRGGIEG